MNFDELLVLLTEMETPNSIKELMTFLAAYEKEHNVMINKADARIIFTDITSQ
jgi:hypothetical protein